ncbi:Eco57I restriction-modification methylase domain-containing protein [Wenjunlia vitaminophila]|uniref:Eco57I restriction-modification methylase domain-containing protein n=1 Tax=Wenjunlia vitaminophila TaxID=76728 RepID=UPI00131A0952|nr:hypothetical protein [Wenjunlia vitaminophila]
MNTTAPSRPCPVDDAAFTRPLARALARHTEALAAGQGPGVGRVAGSWVYTTVLIAWAEDHGLIPTRVRADAEPRRKQHLAAGGTLAGWIRSGLADLAAHPATACLTDPRYNPIGQAKPTEDMLRNLIDWWTTTAPDLAYATPDRGPASITGWLAGDLLQLAGDDRRKGNALCQTPWWICDFLCEHTLLPAITEWPRETLRVIDPACGTGHILTWAMIGLYQWYRSAGPGHPRCGPETAMRRVLAGLHGVELDPLTAAVARLRLTVTAAALLAADGALPAPLRLHDIPGWIRPRVAVGNALLAGQSDLNPPGTILDDTADYPGILTRGTYHAVIANPPYITVKDRATREAIRAAYRDVCVGQFSLSVPFTVLLFDLAIRGGKTATAPPPAQLDLF